MKKRPFSKRIDEWRKLHIIGFLSICIALGVSTLKHDYKLKHNPVYAQKYLERKSPLTMRKSPEGLILTLKNDKGYIQGLDYNEDGIVNEVHNLTDIGRNSGKFKYNESDFEYKQLQERYTKALKRGKN